MKIYGKVRRLKITTPARNGHRRGLLSIKEAWGLDRRSVRRGYHRTGPYNKMIAARGCALFVMTPKGWYFAKFRCSKLEGIERQVLEACFFITGRHGRLFGGGYASAHKIADHISKPQSEENLLKIRLVLKFLKTWTWLSLDYRAKNGSTEGATRIIVSKSCYFLSKKEPVAKPIYVNHIWGSGSDFEVKDLKENVSEHVGLKEAAIAFGFAGQMVRRMTP